MYYNQTCKRESTLQRILDYDPLLIIYTPLIVARWFPLRATLLSGFGTTGTVLLAPWGTVPKEPSPWSHYILATPVFLAASATALATASLTFSLKLSGITYSGFNSSSLIMPAIA